METAAKTGGIPGLKPIMMGLVGFPFLVRAWMGLCGQFHDIPYGASTRASPSLQTNWSPPATAAMRCQ